MLSPALWSGRFGFLAGPSSFLDQAQDCVLISELHLASACLEQASLTDGESHDSSPGWGEPALLLASLHLCRCVDGTSQLWVLSLLGLETSEKAETAGRPFLFGERG